MSRQKFTPRCSPRKFVNVHTLIHSPLTVSAERYVPHADTCASTTLTLVPLQYVADKRKPCGYGAEYAGQVILTVAV